MNNFWIWLIGGIIPYYINLQQKDGEKTFEARALFWSIMVCLHLGKDYQWTVYCPLIKRQQK